MSCKNCKEKDRCPDALTPASEFCNGNEARKYRWISVKDRLPNVFEEVLVAGEMRYESDAELEKFVDIGSFVNGEPFFNSNPRTPADVFAWSTNNDWYEGQQIYRITHWMPLPEPPEEET